MAELLDEIHPGEILQEDFMKPMGITARRFAADIDVSPSRISELVKYRRATCLRFWRENEKSAQPWPGNWASSSASAPPYSCQHRFSEN